MNILRSLIQHRGSSRGLSAPARWLSPRAQGLVEWWTQKKYVGEDRKGNRYFINLEPLPGHDEERREISYSGDWMDKEGVPKVWEAWLLHHRNTPPSIEEEIREEKRFVAHQQRAGVVDAQNRKEDAETMQQYAQAQWEQEDDFDKNVLKDDAFMRDIYQRMNKGQR
eukprot:TRINITY_DN1547_c1_g3_i5.p1 TRINITY_DN1547_c1_g3~~TRINITY_DN1547_c1_g3_i5.p1  ORF type:complete len:167 (+),score=20.32 TRINITY_DN1547_c1_g3_i5:174-674(+)